jgi:hypothetical protein
MRSNGQQPSARWLRIGIAIQLIELQHGRLGKNPGEHQTLCRAIFKHAGGLVCCFKRSLDNTFVAQQASRAFDLHEYSGLARKPCAPTMRCSYAYGQRPVCVGSIYGSIFVSLNSSATRIDPSPVRCVVSSCRGTCGAPYS